MATQQWQKEIKLQAPFMGAFLFAIPINKHINTYNNNGNMRTGPLSICSILDKEPVCEIMHSY